MNIFIQDSYRLDSVKTYEMDKCGDNPYYFFGITHDCKQVFFNNNIDSSMNVFVRSGTGLLRRLLNGDCFIHGGVPTEYMMKGYYYEVEKFDQAYYTKLDLPLLNKDAKVYDVKDIQHVTFSQDIFVKPSSDLKSFSGTYLHSGKTLYEEVRSKPFNPAYETERCLVSTTIKNIEKEYRFFVVNDVVVAGSQYMSQRIVSYLNIIDSDPVWEIAKEYVKLYSPSKAFVIDIALLYNGSYEIVEYNCSGGYTANIEKVYDAVRYL